MTLFDLVTYVVVAIVAYLVGTVYPAWQPEEESEELEPDPQDEVTK